MCHQTPLVELIPAGGGPSKLFARVQAEDARAIVLSQYQPKGFWRRMAHRASGWFDRFLSDETADPAVDRAIDVRDRPVCAFLGPQRHVATEYCGQIDPTDLDEYVRHDGFKALRHCLEELSPEQIIDAGASRAGCGAAAGPAFPPGQKWADGPGRGGREEIRHLQRRRGRPGGLHGPHASGVVSLSHHRGHGDRRQGRWGRRRHLLYSGRVSAGGEADPRGPAQAGRPRPAGRPRAEHRLSLAPFGEGRGGGLRLRRGDRPAGLAGRPPRHAPAAAALPGRVGPLGPADLRQ